VTLRFTDPGVSIKGLIYGGATGRGHLEGLYKTEAESANFIEAFASQKLV
jgi:hypothetical protein